MKIDCNKISILTNFISLKKYRQMKPDGTLFLFAHDKPKIFLLTY